MENTTSLPINPQIVPTGNPPPVIGNTSATQTPSVSGITHPVFSAPVSMPAVSQQNTVNSAPQIAVATPQNFVPSGNQSAAPSVPGPATAIPQFEVISAPQNSPPSLSSAPSVPQNTATFPGQREQNISTIMNQGTPSSLATPPSIPQAFAPPIVNPPEGNAPPPPSYGNPTSPLGKLKHSIGLVLVLIVVGGAPLGGYILFTKDTTPEQPIEPKPIALSSAPDVPVEVVSTGSEVASGGTISEPAPVAVEKEDLPEIHKVFKILTYSKSEGGGYSLDSYGSAILIGKNQILTNAHVVMGADDLPTGKYNLCLTHIDGEEPLCVTGLRLIKYDVLKDIALLEPINKSYLGIPIELNDRKLSLGETVKVYGYPGNGGSTLSFTEGKMSGTEKGYYKVDANIDRGNSGGGAFDKDDNFIGMPFSAQRGLTTMGYIIPVNMIQDFMKGVGDITSYSKDQSEFSDYISRMNAVITKQKVSNPYFNFDGFNELGFMLKEITGDPENGFATYVFSTKTENTIISINVPYQQGSTYYPYNSSKGGLEEQFETVRDKYNTLIGGKKVDLEKVVIGLKKENETIDDNIAIRYYEMKGISYTLMTKASKAERVDFENGIALFEKNFSLTKLSPMQTSSNIEFYSGTLTLPPGTYAVRKCSERCDYSIVVDSNVKIELATSQFTIDKDDTDTMMSIMNYIGENMLESLDEYGGTGELALHKTPKGITYIYKYVTWGDGTVDMSATFYGKDKENRVIQYSIKTSINKTNALVKTNFEKIIDSVFIRLPRAFQDK